MAIIEGDEETNMAAMMEFEENKQGMMNTILRRIVRNPNDFKAICEFNFFAIYDNIIRYSSYLFGNSAPLEYIMLFPEIGKEQR